MTFQSYATSNALLENIIREISLIFEKDTLYETLEYDNQVLIKKIDNLTYKMAIIIGLFQLIAAIFPGTSRSGATILGALLIGVSRDVAAEFTFFLAIPVMFGASLLKLIKFGLVFTSFELIVLLVGMLVAFIVSN
jgi:undecaprenyl-diphosphatase